MAGDDYQIACRRSDTSLIRGNGETGKVVTQSKGIIKEPEVALFLLS